MDFAPSNSYDQTMSENPKSIAIITVTSGMQLHIAATDFSKKEVVDMGVALSRIEAQKLAYALLQYAGVAPIDKNLDKKKTVVCGTFRPDFKPQSVAYYGAKR